ncbi:ABC transporter substrate-binding protein [Nocardioides baekrokdamisoli]|uniref:ABC transporter substrate-binding protein n=1 Tax=Nocardioides baekrokdamisoli TaxID=1804624 RepID=A0A3G9IQS4_9ACTN|nr:MCE family protein [Nocardioides baekrokdamisoli]BBH18405.1 ABC transporter substrate-binding protein [Nocardioides baekrokdamisoli]
MSTRNVRTVSAAIKLGIFVVVSLLVTGLLAVIMGHLTVGSQHGYKAIFTTASELKSGDDVRVAGVSVGTVTGVEIYNRNEAIVSFDVTSGLQLTKNSGAEIRFLNIVGDRYLALSQGEASTQMLNPGDTIPATQTTPALDLTALFNGFQPLFQALTPKDVNDLSMNLIQVLQGESGNVSDLLAKTASLTNSLADRDQLINEVITNLGGTLATIDSRHQQLSDLLTGLEQWMGHLSNDRVQIGDSIQNISTLTQELADLLTQARPFTKEDIAQLRRVMTILNQPSAQAALDAALKQLPTTLRRQARIGTFGSWYNYYLCDFTGRVILPQLGTLLNLGPVAAQANSALNQIQAQINKYLNVYSTQPRCAN